MIQQNQMIMTQNEMCQKMKSFLNMSKLDKNIWKDYWKQV